MKKRREVESVVDLVGRILKSANEDIRLAVALEKKRKKHRKKKKK